MLVVLLHLTANTNEILHTDFLGNIFLFGGSGVDIFFVLSGFIITYTSVSYLSQPSHLPQFAKRRLVRIYPIYWVTITGFLLLQLLLPSYYDTHFQTSFSNLAATYFLLPGHVMLNGVSWSLTNELFFYLIFIIAFVLPRPIDSFYLMLAYLIVLIIFSTGYPVLPVKNAYAQLLLHPMNIEFFLGVIAAIFFVKLPAKLIYVSFFMGIILFVTGAVLYNLKIPVLSDKVNSELERVLLFGIPSFLIIVSLVKFEYGKPIRVPSFFLKLGDASYSLYLIHLPLVVAALKIADRFNINGSLPVLLLGVMIILSVCAVGIFVYQYIEKPLIKRLNAIF